MRGDASDCAASISANRTRNSGDTTGGDANPAADAGPAAEAATEAKPGHG